MEKMMQNQMEIPEKYKLIIQSKNTELNQLHARLDQIKGEKERINEAEIHIKRDIHRLEGYMSGLSDFIKNEQTPVDPQKELKVEEPVKQKLKG
jgi:hypothetical protein